MQRNGTIGEVVHAWAHQLSEGPFSTPNGSLYWRDKTIYSYGNHFPIATFRDDIKGYEIVFTGDKYSNSTAKHISATRSAINHLRDKTLFLHIDSVYPTDTPDSFSTAAFKRYKEIIEELPTKRPGAGPFDRLLFEWQSLISLQEKLPKKAVKKAFRVPPLDDNLDEKLAAARKYHLTLQKKRAEEKRKKDAADIEKWRRGELTGVYRASFQYLKRVDDQVHTSSGARFPVEHAVIAWNRLKQYYETGRELPTIRFGHFSLDRIKSNGDLVAGCHTIPKDEVIRFASELGLEAPKC